MGTASSSRRRSPKRPASARERLERTAYELFSRHGIRAVGVDTIVARAGVAKMTLYKHFRSKDELVLSFLRAREELWSRAWLQAELERSGGTAAEKLLAVFDVFDKWFRRQDFEVVLEHSEREHPVHQAAVRHIANIRSFIARLAGEAGMSDPDEFARQWQILMIGAIVAAAAGDFDAARRAKGVAVRLIRQL
jgi:AcrR family transcriptional regulator